MKRNIIILILMIAFVFVFGTVAFHLIESWSLFDSFFSHSSPFPRWDTLFLRISLRLEK